MGYSPRLVLTWVIVVLALALLIVPRLGGSAEPGETADESEVGLDEEPSEVAPYQQIFEDPEAAGRAAREELFGGFVTELLEEGSPLPFMSRSYAALVADFNGDGLDDIQLSRHHNLRFAPTDIDGVWVANGDGGYGFTQALPPFSDRHGCAAADVNGDGATDFYCTQGASRGAVAEDSSGAVKTKANELWINRGNATFVDRAEEWGVTDPWGRGRDALFFDYDNDGDPDLYVVNAYGRVDDLRSINILYRNEGDRFEEVDSVLNGEFGHKCPAAFDWNDDGWQDVMVCRNGSPVFFQNEGGDFSDVTTDVLPARKGWQHAVAEDLDGDGDEDLAVMRKTAIEVWLWNANQGRFRLETKVDFEGEGRWIAVGDFYADGSMDVYGVLNREGCIDVDKSSGNAHDLLLVGPTFEAHARATHNLGCGDRAYPVDESRVLILNGAVKTRGPVEVVELRTNAVPIVRLPVPND